MKFDHRQAHDDAQRVIFKAFQDRLAPLLAEVSPDWLLHHMELLRMPGSLDPFEERVEIRLVLKPLGSVREAQPVAVELLKR